MYNKQFNLFVLLICTILIFACSKGNSPNTSESFQNSPRLDPPGDDKDRDDDETDAPDDTSGFKGTWDISFGDVVLGCFGGQDCIPSIQNPRFVSSDAVSYLSDDDYVFGLSVNGEARAYPEKILDWHEVVNDVFGNQSITVSYCPLTGSAVALDLHKTAEPVNSSNFESVLLEFGISGFLHNNNLIQFDRGTGSNWSQMYLRCVNGLMRGTKMVTVPLIHTTWGTWKKMFPQSIVLSDDTGFNRNYDNFPYGNYKEVEDLLFRLTVDDHRLFFKEKLHGVVSSFSNMTAKTYRYDLFADGARAINDNVDGLDVVVAGMKDADFYIAYSRRLQDGTKLRFSLKTDSPSIFPFDLVDNEGTTWNILGEAIEGPRTGQKLEFADSYNAYWFAWGSFFPGVPIFQ